MIKRLEKIVSGVVTGVALAGSGIIIEQSLIEFKSMFVDTAIRVEASNQLTRNFKHNLMIDHKLVSGKVIKKGEPIRGSYREMKSTFIPYTLKTESGEIYNGASRGNDIFNAGDDVTALLGWPLDCDCDSPRIIEAYQK